MTQKKVKITKHQFSEAIGKLLESNSFSAMRNIQHMATSTSMEFERSILDALGLVDPDHLQDDLQKKYYIIVMNMKNTIVSAAMNATKELLSFPKEDHSGNIKK